MSPDLDPTPQSTFPPELSKSRLISLLHDAGYTIKEMIAMGYGLAENHCRSSVRDFTLNKYKAEDARRVAKEIGFQVPPKAGHNTNSQSSIDPLSNLIELYKEKVRATNNSEEIYKWQFVEKFKGWPDVNAADFGSEINKIDFGRLIYNLGRGVLIHLSKERPEELRTCFKALFNENLPLGERLISFNSDTLSLYRELIPDKKISHHQDERTMSAYLTYHDPNKYTFYKSTVYTGLCNLLSIKPAAAKAKYPHYLDLVRDFITRYINTDTELLELKRQFLPENAFSDETNLILAQDILSQTLENVDKTSDNDEENAIIQILKKAGLNNSTIFFDKARELVNALNVNEEDSRLTFGIQDNNRMHIIIGQRYCLGLSMNKKIPWSFISTEKIGSSDNIRVTNFDGIPEAYYYQCVDAADMLSRMNDVIEASRKELSRTKLSGYRRTNHNALERAVFDLDYRQQLFSKAFGNMKTTPVNSISNVTGKKIDLSLNTIFYGPPGTGKTYRLGQYKDEYFTDRGIPIPAEDLLREKVSNYRLWQILAAVLYTENRYISVSELALNPLVSVKFNHDAKTPRNSIWNALQSYSDSESSKMVEKRGDQLFNKNSESEWSIIGSQKSDIINYIDEELLVLASNPVVTDIPASNEKIRYNFITFHQKYSYEDFIEGIKPLLKKEEEEETSGSDLQFELKRGVFYLSCVEALKLAGYNNFKECYADTSENRRQNFAAAEKDPSRQFALLIDEINRANISAVFGELITLLEDDKRMGRENELWVELPYSNEKFCVPANLYVIGTMNTADRSIALLDIALRRRFEFKALYPEYGDSKWWSPLLQRLNQAIYSVKKNPDFFIGHAFFLNKPEVDTVKILNTKIIPLLYEYCQNNADAVKRILSDSGVNIRQTSITENFQIIAE